MKRRMAIAVLAVLVTILGLIAGTAGTASAATTPKTVVSLTFDDSTSDQVAIPAILSKYGMKGTFYAISQRLGESGYMTAAQLKQIQAAGEEIGGHTQTHPDLPTLPPAQQQQEMCQGRADLQALGLTIDTLAYPFGDYDATTEQIAKSCGFSGARGIGGIDCSGCDKAETIPPADPYAIQDPDSIKSTDNLSTIEGYVTKAEKNGGWIVLTMHHLCSGSSCDTYSISPTMLNSFLKWLQPRAAQGTVVKTMGQVMGPGGSTPPPPPPPSTLQNPSLETDANADGVPDCWQLGGFGTNTPVWTRTSDAHSGSWAEKLQLTSITDGDAKLVTQQHDSTCEPQANIGHTDTFNAWYKSDQPIHLVAYYQDATGTWTFWDQSNELPASSGWTQATWTTPAVPTGSARLSFGLSLRAVGTVTMDDFGLAAN